jgi:adenine-specific DNA-methyltransferase
MPKQIASQKQLRDLASKVDAIRVRAASELDQSRRSELGQFFTPWSVASLMASMSVPPAGALRLLDPGAGVGSLTAAWLSNACARPVRPESVHIVAYEVDQALLRFLERTLKLARSAAKEFGVAVSWDIRNADYIAEGAKAIGTVASVERFDAAIINPPYRKIRSDAESRATLRTVGIESSNLYTAFLAITLRLLKQHGQLTAITPRSFCNGPYFKSFRLELLRSLDLKRIHVFESRDRAFADDDVLQENIIIHGAKGTKQSPAVTVSSNDHPGDPVVVSREVAFGSVVRRDDPESFIHVVPSEWGLGVADRSRRMASTLSELGLTVSTGRVVDFRATEFLRQTPESGTVPLIYPRHFKAGFVEWPKPTPKKADAILASEASASLLVPAGIYVLVRRFSAKEERRRIVAAVFDPNRVPSAFVGFENHVNYFHRNGRPLSRALAIGLTAYLNSTFVDDHFRQFSGHTQVNATDLRSLRYPTLGALEQLGQRFGAAFPDQAVLDESVSATIAIDGAAFAGELALGV